MNFLSPRSRRRKSDSVDKLRIVYADLLDHIGKNSDDFEERRRGVNEADIELQKRSKRFFSSPSSTFRKNVLPLQPKQQSTAGQSERDLATPSENCSRNNSEFRAEGESIITRNVVTSSSNSSLLGSSDEKNEDSLFPTIKTTSTSEYELESAFRMMAATKAPDKEHQQQQNRDQIIFFSDLTLREDAQAMAMATAAAIEKRVVELIRSIGEYVMEGDLSSEGAAFNINRTASSVRGDAVFEYFCEKSMLALIVDIAKDNQDVWNIAGSQPQKIKSTHHAGVVWSPVVKAQVYSTVAHLLSSRNLSVIYYLLSHNHINDLIQCILPLNQWTDQALSKMLPPYLDMLQKCALQLAEDPSLFSLFTVPKSSRAPVDRNCSSEQLQPNEIDNETNFLFPLYSTVLEIATSNFAQSDSLVYGTCWVVVVNILQVQDESIQMWIGNGHLEQHRLSDHLSHRLLDRYIRIVNLTSGPVVDGIRSHAIAAQLAGLKDHLSMIHEIFWSGVRGLDVRLCESLLQKVITVLLKNLVTNRRRSFLTGVGLLDADVIPEQEALAQVSCVILTFLFSALAYVPFQRMLAVALFHEMSTPLFMSHTWMKDMQNSSSSSAESYIFMPLLSDIVTGENERETCHNLFLEELTKGLSGEYGDWRSAAAACLFQAAINSKAMDRESTRLLHIIPTLDENDHEYTATPLEQAIAAYLSRDHKPSSVTLQALDHVGYLAVQTVHETILQLMNCDGHIHAGSKNERNRKINFVRSCSPVWQALGKARSFFVEQALHFQEKAEVSDVFLDVLESVIKSRYTCRYDENGKPSFRCLLSQYGVVSSAGASSELLVRRLKCIGTANDIESLRFYLRAMLHFQALGNVLERFCLQLMNARSEVVESVNLDLVEVADELVQMIGNLSRNYDDGMDINLTGRMTFPFESVPHINVKERKKHESLTHLRLKQSKLLLVLDPVNMLVVRPTKSEINENRATIICTISLRSVIAAAEDENWLHVAVRHEDVGSLIKNGNMALHLESNGSCLIVKQYLDRSRETLRREMLVKANTLLDKAAAVNGPSSSVWDEDRKDND